MQRPYLWLFALLTACAGIGWRSDWIPNVLERSEITKLLEAVRSRDVQFATMRYPRSLPHGPGRRIVVTAPPELSLLTGSGDVRVLDGLIELLNHPARAWAAEVALAAMTGHDAVVVEGYSSSPEEWLKTLGPMAQTQWKEWLDQRRDRLSWDAESRLFVDKTTAENADK